MGGNVRIGVGGWTFEPWRGTFFPAGLPHKRELAHMAGRLSSVEVNGTFYRTQTPETFAKWRDETPEDFVFALKAPRYATNRRELASAGESVGRFVESGIVELGAGLGPINWQLAPTKKFDAEDFAAFLDLLPAEAGGLRLRHAVEARHPSFGDPAVEEISRARGVAVIMAGDGPHPRFELDTADFAYARIMGTRADAEAGYPEAELDAWADWAQRIAASGRDVFVYVIGGEKRLNPAAAEALIARLGGR